MQYCIYVFGDHLTRFKQVDSCALFYLQLMLYCSIGYIQNHLFCLCRRPDNSKQLWSNPF